MKYAILTLAGIGLFRVLSAVACAERGYFAVGGEVFALLLPVIWYLLENVLRDTADWWKEVRRDGKIR